jgi:hypothetical protein
MKAALIREGAKLYSEGVLIYTVLSVNATGTGEVSAVVRFTDGGTDVRVWDRDKEVPLTYDDNKED